ncbi:MAG: chorismate synthase [Candidatus Lokiarchaeota archaeon]|nr:chorismate synthase [Candidatus Harpocratesius repetitus]
MAKITEIKSKLVGCFKFNSQKELLLQISQINAVTEIDVIEVRLDYLKPEECNPKILQMIRNQSKKPLILTIRDPEEGGMYNFSINQRLELIQAAMACNYDFIDIEFKNLALWQKIRNLRQSDQNKLFHSTRNNTKFIISHHLSISKEFDHLLHEMKEILSIQGIYPKIVLSINSELEAERLEQFQFYFWNRFTDKNLTIFGMGAHSQFSRILGAKFGNFFTYVGLNPQMLTAANQITLSTFLLDYSIFYSMTLGSIFSVSGFGTSHGYKIGCIISGVPKGFSLNFDHIEAMLRLRRPGFHQLVSPRKELDEFVITNGLGDSDGLSDSDGSVISVVSKKYLRIIILNKDVRSKDYSLFDKIPRPSHVDYPARLRFGKDINLNGSGFFSGRLSAVYVMGGAIALQLLATRNIHIYAYISQIGKIKDDHKYSINKLKILNKQRLISQSTMGDSFKQKISKINTIDNYPNDFSPVNNHFTKSQRFIGNPDPSIASEMLREIEQAYNKKDSVGGIINVIVDNFPAGIGNPWFQSLESLLSQAIFGIPGVRGIEFGLGFRAAEMYGSEHNDPYILENGKIKTKSNNSGGIIGGISTGMSISFQIAIKPTASIGKVQNTLNLQSKKMEKLKIPGRHDPCIVPRILPVVESVTAIILLDVLFSAKKD